MHCPGVSSNPVLFQPGRIKCLAYEFSAKLARICPLVAQMTEIFGMPPTAETETSVDTSILDEMVHWIKTLKDVGVSPDTAAKCTSDFFIAAGVATTEEVWDDEGEEEEEF